MSPMSPPLLHQYLSRTAQATEDTSKQLGTFESRVADVEAKLKQTNASLTGLDARVESARKDVAALLEWRGKAAPDGLERLVYDFMGKFEKQQSQIAALESRVVTLENQVKEHERRLHDLECEDDDPPPAHGKPAKR